MNKCRTISMFLSSVCCSLLACGGSPADRQGGDMQSMATKDMGSASDLGDTADMAPDPYSWGEATPGVTVGPFGDLKLFRNGCGTELFARWIPKRDFDLQVVTSRIPNLGTKQISYIDIPHYKDQQKVVIPLFTASTSNPFPLADYSSDFTVGYPDMTTLTYTATVPVENGLYRWPGVLSEVSHRYGGSNGDLYVTVQSTLNGRVDDCKVYDDNGCIVGDVGSSTPLVKGASTELLCGGKEQPGQHYTVLVQGLDTDRNYPFYATFDIQ